MRENALLADCRAEGMHKPVRIHYCHQGFCHTGAGTGAGAGADTGADTGAGTGIVAAAGEEVGAIWWAVGPPGKVLKPPVHCVFV